MRKKTTISYIYTTNFSIKKRSKKQIKFVIFHYTGMISEKKAIKKLTTTNSNVSCHYFVKKDGNIIKMLPELYVAWHAGKSHWKNYKKLNNNSIGVEIQNPGHKHGYVKFTKKQIKSILDLSKHIIKKFNIKKNCILGHSDIAPDRKVDPGEKFPWKHLSKKNIGIWHSLNDRDLAKKRGLRINKNQKMYFLKILKKIGYQLKNEKKSIKAFQRRFRQKKINGVIDQECLKIINNLAPKFM